VCRKLDTHLRSTLMLAYKHPRAQLTHSQMKSVKALVSQWVGWSFGLPVPQSLCQLGSFRPFIFLSISLPCLRILFFFGSFFFFGPVARKKRYSSPSIKIKVFVCLPEGMLNVRQHFRECMRVVGGRGMCGMWHVPHTVTATIRQV